MEGLRRALLAQAEREGNVYQQRELKKTDETKTTFKIGTNTSIYGAGIC